MDWYKYRLMYRGKDDDEERNDLHRFGKLFQQYVVDMYAKMESNRLHYIRHNQGRLRSDLYSGVVDAVNLGDSDMQQVGRRVILPSSFTGGPRHMQQLYQDAMSIVRRYGKPDLFITFTCNPKWPEIEETLLPNQVAADRPDITVRVFKMKLKALMDDLTTKHVLGRVVGHVHTIEFQKRGLPHAHILLILAPNDKPETAADVDNIVSAELPNAELYPAARATVERCMMHGPCGPTHPSSPCMKDGRCTRNFPKHIQNETLVNDDGYPEYRRRSNNGDHARRNGVNLDNRWVVPHNIFLCTKYNAHINVEICTSIQSIKYVYKYVYKGHDRASISVGDSNVQENHNVDEIREYLDARYVSPTEGCWRIFGFSMHKEFPPNQRLAIHLENEQLIYFQESENPAEIVSRASETTLTAWFAFNAEEHNEHARTILYPNFPEHYVFMPRARQWKIRERGFSIGRIYAVSPRDVEKYHLRLLLYHVPGATSFDDLKTVDGVAQPSFQAAARLRGLLTGQQEWHDCLEQAALYQNPRALRQLFAIILVFCYPENPHELWIGHRDALSDDILYAVQQATNQPTLRANDNVYSQALLAIEDVMAGLSRSLTEFDGFILPEDTRQQIGVDHNEPFIIREHQRLIAEVMATPQQPTQFNNEQQAIFDQICASMQQQGDQPRLHFVDGPGGTGKTYLLNTLIDHVRRTRGVVIAVAISGTASTLLKGGRTAHSTFRIPINVHSGSTCGFTPRTATARLLHMTQLIVWDEASMISRDVVQTVNRSLQDLFKNDLPFGGKVVVFGGDFRQVHTFLPFRSLFTD